MRTWAGALFSFVILATSAQAQDWPARPVTMIVPYAAGGPVDTVGRIMAQGLSEVLGQQVIVENVGGAGGMTGATRVAKAMPDGYTFLLGGSATMTTVPALYGKKTPYNPLTDFEHVIQFADSARILIARKDFPANSLQEFVAYAKQNAEALKYGSSGTGAGAHICALLLDQAMGVKITHVPYRGSGPAMNDLISGQVDYFCDTVSGGVPQIQSGTVKGLAYFGKTRSSALPDLPTAQEQGLAGFEAYTWNAVFAAKATPEPIVRRLNEAVIAALEDETVKARLAQLGAQIVTPERRTPGYLAEFVKAEVQKWAAPIKASGARME